LATWSAFILHDWNGLAVDLGHTRSTRRSIYHLLMGSFVVAIAYCAVLLALRLLLH
jgi:hypothetical protein